MKPTLVLILILLVLVVVSCGGYALGQLGNDLDCECPAQEVGNGFPDSDSVREVKAGLSDLASALARIEGGDNPELTAQTLLRLQEYHSCWPKLMEGESRSDFSDSEEMAMTMVTFGTLLSLSVWSGESFPSDESFDEAMEKCANLQ